jgi:hypothetical protein
MFPKQSFSCVGHACCAALIFDPSGQGHPWQGHHVVTPAPLFVLPCHCLELEKNLVTTSVGMHHGICSTHCLKSHCATYAPHAPVRPEHEPQPRCCARRLRARWVGACTSRHIKQCGKMHAYSSGLAAERQGTAEQGSTQQQQGCELICTIATHSHGKV